MTEEEAHAWLLSLTPKTLWGWPLQPSICTPLVGGGGMVPLLSLPHLREAITYISSMHPEVVAPPSTGFISLKCPMEAFPKLICILKSTLNQGPQCVKDIWLHVLSCLDSQSMRSQRLRHDWALTQHLIGVPCSGSATCIVFNVDSSVCLLAALSPLLLFFSLCPPCWAVPGAMFTFMLLLLEHELSQITLMFKIY